LKNLGKIALTGDIRSEEELNQQKGNVKMKTLKVVLLAVMVAVTGYAQEVKETEPPKALVKAREAYQKELKRVTDPVSRDYLRTLESLKKDFGTKGDTANMVAVQKEIDAVKEDMENGTGTEAEAEKFIIGQWRWQDGAYTSTILFASNHTLQVSNGDSGTWRVKDSKWILQFNGNGSTCVVLLPLKNRVEVWDKAGKELKNCSLTKLK
jgi:hypothetical protein